MAGYINAKKCSISMFGFFLLLCCSCCVLQNWAPVFKNFKPKLGKSGLFVNPKRALEVKCILSLDIEIIILQWIRLFCFIVILEFFRVEHK